MDSKPPKLLPRPVQVLLELYQSALSAADPIRVVPPNLPPPPPGRTVVVGMGKAAAAMAKAVEQFWFGPLEGVVVVPKGMAAAPLRRICVVEASHPVPDESSVRASCMLLDAVSGLTENDLVIALISGGGSALCAMPAPGLALAEKQRITRALLLRGATIGEINVVRKHLSAIKGGRLAVRALPAKVFSIVISDVPGDDPAMVASGPTFGDDSTCSDALAILVRFNITIDDAALEALSGSRWESVKPRDRRLEGHNYRVASSARDGLQAAANRLRRDTGVRCHVLSDRIEGESREIAKMHAAIAASVLERNEPFRAPCVILSGGEATVNVKGEGRGGRNTEFALAMALALQGRPDIYALSAGTDGLDGNSGAAGAWIGPESLSDLRAARVNPLASLDANDSGAALDTIDNLIVTGPTSTNINDFRAIWVGDSPKVIASPFEGLSTLEILNMAIGG